MKFFYNGKQIRTSTSHVYRYAFMYGDSCVSCHETYGAAEKKKKSYVRDTQEWINNYKLALRDSKIYLAKLYTAEQLADKIKECENNISSMIIVPLEMKLTKSEQAYEDKKKAEREAKQNTRKW
jgi:hypothetical protein